MIDIRIPKEIRKYKEKFFFGLTFRQSICLALALIINVPLYILGKDVVGNDLMGWIIILTSIPFMCIGFVNYDGMNFEQLFIAFLKHEAINPKKRIYETDNLFREIDMYEINNSKHLMNFGEYEAYEVVGENEERWYSKCLKFLRRKK